MFAKHQGKSGFLAVFARYFSLYRVVHTHTQSPILYADMEICRYTL